MNESEYLYNKPISKTLKVILSFLFIFLLTFPFYVDKKGVFVCNKNNKEFLKKEPSDLDKLLDKLKQSESGGDYSITNQFGFLGAYQIGRTALKEIGMEGVPDSIFLRIPSLQDIAARKILKKNRDYLYAYIKKYKGDTICDVIITESGLIAAGYGTGAGSVMKFLDSNGVEDPVDGNGVSTSFLIKKYSGYKLVWD